MEQKELPEGISCARTSLDMLEPKLVMGHREMPFVVDVLLLLIGLGRMELLSTVNNSSSTLHAELGPQEVLESVST